MARGGSFAAAASALWLTPSAVSQQMGALEREAGVTLFERTARGMLLTDAGVALTARADAVLAELIEATRELEAIADGRAGSVRVGSFTSATATFVAAGVEAFRELHPDVDIRFVDSEPHENLARLKARELDMAVIFDLDHWPAGTGIDGEPLCSDDELDCIELFDDPLVIVLPREHRLSGEQALSFEQISGEPVLCGPPWAVDLVQAASSAGVELRVDASCQATGFEALQAFVAAGRGLTVIPRLATGWLRESLVHRRLANAPARHVKAATPAGAPPSPVTEAMLQLIRAGAATLDAPATRATVPAGS